jgi:hypothetical protein
MRNLPLFSETDANSTPTSRIGKGEKIFTFAPIGPVERTLLSAAFDVAPIPVRPMSSYECDRWTSQSGCCLECPDKNVILAEAGKLDTAPLNSSHVLPGCFQLFGDRDPIVQFML